MNLQWICASQAATTVFIAQRTICWIPPFSSSSSSKAVFKAGMKRPSYISAQPTWAEPFGSERMRMWLRTSWPWQVDAGDSAQCGCVLYPVKLRRFLTCPKHSGLMVFFIWQGTHPKEVSLPRHGTKSSGVSPSWTGRADTPEKSRWLLQLPATGSLTSSKSSYHGTSPYDDSSSKQASENSMNI